MEETLKYLNGNVKFKREDSILFFNANLTSCDENGIVFDRENPKWVPIGEDNDELTREQNNELDSKKNVLGKTNIDHTSGAEVMEVDPYAIRGNDALSYILYMIYKYKLTGDKAKIETLDVTYGDVVSDGTYGAFTEDAVVDLKSWGGDTTKLNSPISLNFEGNRVHGTFSTANNTFTKTTAA